MYSLKRVASIIIAPLALLGTSADARLADAAMNGDAEIIRPLLAAHANVNTAQPDCTTALHWAVRHDDPPPKQQVDKERSSKEKLIKEATKRIEALGHTRDQAERWAREAWDFMHK